MNYLRWNTPEVIKKSRQKIKDKTKRECIKEHLYAEWMAVYRAKRKGRQLWEERISSYVYEKDELVRQIVQIVGTHQEKTYISKKIIDNLNILLTEPSVPITVSLPDFQRIWNSVVFSAGHSSANYSLEYVSIECGSNFMVATCCDRRVRAVSKTHAEGVSPCKFFLHKKLTPIIIGLKGKTLTIDFGNIMQFYVDGKIKHEIPRPLDFKSLPGIDNLLEIKANTFIRGHRSDFLYCLEKFHGRTNEIKIVMKYNSNYVKRPVRFYAGNGRKEMIEIISPELNWEGNDLKIGVNAKTFYDAITHAHEKEIEVAFIGEGDQLWVSTKSKDYVVRMMDYSPAEKR